MNGGANGTLAVSVTPVWRGASSAPLDPIMHVQAPQDFSALPVHWVSARRGGREIEQGE